MAAPTYPLKLSANRRFLTDAQGQPLLVHGDTPWSLFSALDEVAVERYLADRASKALTPSLPISSNIASTARSTPMASILWLTRKT